MSCPAPMDILTETTPDIPIIQKPEILIIQSCRSEIPIIPKLPVGNSDNSNYWSTSGITGRNYWRTSGELFPKLPGGPPKVAGCAFCPHLTQKNGNSKVAGAHPKLPDRKIPKIQKKTEIPIIQSCRTGNSFFVFVFFY